MRENRDILDKLRATITDMEFYEAPGEWLVPVEQAKAEIERLRAALREIAGYSCVTCSDFAWTAARAVLEEGRT